MSHEKTDNSKESLEAAVDRRITVLKSEENMLKVQLLNVISELEQLYGIRDVTYKRSLTALDDVEQSQNSQRQKIHNTFDNVQQIKNTTLVALDNLDDILEYLVKTEDSCGVVNHIRQKWPKCLDTYLTTLKNKVRGLNLQSNDFEHAYDLVLSKVYELSENTMLISRMEQFKAMNTVDRHHLQKALHQNEVYTGNDLVDEWIKYIPIVPQFMSELSTSDAEKRNRKSQSLAQLQVKCNNMWTILASKMIEQSISVLNNDRANSFETAVALGLLTGRRLVEIFKIGIFKLTSNENVVSFGEQAKTRVTVKKIVEGYDDQFYDIPLLAKAQLVVKALTRLRQQKNCTELNNREVNLKYCNSCTSAAKKLIGIGRTFGDLRSAYAMIAYYSTSPHQMSINAFVQRVLGHATITTSITYTSVKVENLREEHKFVWNESV